VISGICLLQIIVWFRLWHGWLLLVIIIVKIISKVFSTRDQEHIHSKSIVVTCLSTGYTELYFWIQFELINKLDNKSTEFSIIQFNVSATRNLITSKGWQVSWLRKPGNPNGNYRTDTCTCPTFPNATSVVR